MIYLIRSAAFKDKNNPECNEYESLLKIGYTKDGSKKSRFNAYITENPTIQILYLIPKGDRQDEKNLHYYFRQYKRECGQEWFEYNKEIIDFFKTHTTKKSLSGLKTYYGDKNSRSFNKYYKERNRLVPELTKKYISKILSSFEKVDDKYIELTDTLPNKLKDLLENNLDINNVDNYFKLSYPGIDFSLSVNLDKDIIKEIDNIENKYTIFEDRMKYIYSLDASPEFMKLILDNLIDSSYAKYYYSISRERAKALKFQRGNLEKEYISIKSHILNQDNIISEIKNRFKVGNRYDNVFIKESLKFVYESNGYNKTPKANDLEEYFDIKPCKVLNEITGKRDNGFEIIKLKT